MKKDEEILYKCPYCGQSRVKRTKKLFDSWRAVGSHVSSCVNNTKEYYIHHEYGPIHYTMVSNRKEDMVESFLTRSHEGGAMRRSLRRRGVDI